MTKLLPLKVNPFTLTQSYLYPKVDSSALQFRHICLVFHKIFFFGGGRFGGGGGGGGVAELFF